MLATIGKTISTIIIGVALTVAGWFGYAPEQPIGADTQLFLGGTTYTLAGSGITSSVASITLTSFTIPMTGQKIQDSDLSDTFYMTLEPGNTTRQEFASCTTVTQNSGGTATLSGCTRGLSPISPYTASTTLRFSHAGGTKLIFSNPPQLYDQAAFKGNDESITGTWTFASTSIPTLDAYLAPTDDADFASKKYIDDTAIAGGVVGTESTAGIWKGSTQLQMASSTASSGGYGLCLQSRYATSSPYTSGLWTPITQNNGKLSQSFLDLTEDFTFSGGLIAGNATTTNATSTMLSVSSVLTVPGLLSLTGTHSGINLNDNYISDTSFSVSSGNTNYAQPTGAEQAIIRWNATTTSAGFSLEGNAFLVKTGATSTNVGGGISRSSDVVDYCLYTLLWTSTNINILEKPYDVYSNCNLIGVISWYK